MVIIDYHYKTTLKSHIIYTRMDPWTVYTSFTEAPSFVLVSIIILAGLLVLSAFFSLSETAFSCYNKIRMENLAKKHRSARLVMKLGDHYERVLSTILIGNNIVNIAASSLATLVFVSRWGDIGTTYATIIVTLVVLILGEVSPKSLAKQRPEFFARINVWLLYFFYYLFFPVAIILSGIQMLIKKLIKVKEEEEVPYTEEEFSMLVEDMNEARVLNDIEEDIIQNTIEYGDTKVEEIMIKAKDVHFVRRNMTLQQICEEFVRTNRSRMVVTKHSKLDSAYGVIHQKDLFELLVKGEKDVSKIIMTDIVVCKPTHKISRLFKKLQAAHQHLAIVKDEEKVVGIVTMEDILEELVGEIKDENDED